MQPRRSPARYAPDQSVNTLHAMLELAGFKVRAADLPAGQGSELPGNCFVIDLADPPALAEAVREKIASLTPREYSVAKMIVAGKSNKLVARELGISPRTVEIYRHQVMRKLGARNIFDLLRIVYSCRLMLCNLFSEDARKICDACEQARAGQG